MLSLFSLALAVLPFTTAAPAKRAAPTVELSYATLVGSSLLGIDSFTGIPYAQSPVGQLRLKPPQPISSNLGTLELPLIATSCPQMFFSDNSSSELLSLIGELADNPLLQTVTVAGEDCLNLNIRRPSTATATSKLPVVFWIFGGAFELGSPEMYDGSELVAKSVIQGKDVITVAVNYRVGGFGWLPGKEILADGSANLGLLDQRLGLQWVADNIAAFGGDPEKVTIWGESAGAISVFDQMAMYNGNYTYKGKPLFRGAIMNSGSIVPAEPVDSVKGQAVYDQVVATGGCSGASDTLACLRTLDYETFLNAVNSVPGILSYNSVALSYVPRPDGTVITVSPDQLAAEGLFAPVPFIIGDQEDEGTLFALFQSNITTTAEIVTYLHTLFFPTSPVSDVEALVAQYPDDITVGSPFRTGILNNFYPQFKRLAAILGDTVFTMQRRKLLEIASAINPTVPSWSYLASYDHAIPILGTTHGSDILQIFGLLEDFPTASIQDYYISFFNELNPNTGTTGVENWPQWSESNVLLQFDFLTNAYVTDNFRSAAGAFIANATLKI